MYHQRKTVTFAETPSPGQLTLQTTTPKPADDLESLQVQMNAIEATLRQKASEDAGAAQQERAELTHQQQELRAAQQELQVAQKALVAGQNDLARREQELADRIRRFAANLAQIGASK